MGRLPESNTQIHFGTNGWRGILGEDFTFPRLRAAMHGVAGWFGEQGRGREVIVAHDTRFLGERMAELAARVLRQHGMHAVLARGPEPTPVVVRAIPRRRAAGAVILTASHNAPEYQGLKVFDARGVPLADAQARRIEARIPAADPGAPSDAAPVPRVALRAAYLRALRGQLDRRSLEGAEVKVIYDAMHGAGAGVLDRVLEGLGLPVRVLRGEPDPGFGGSPPDPSPRHLRELTRVVRRLRGPRLGLATDGDADRYAVLDADGRMLSETESLALLVDHLARTGRAERGVAISIATGSLVERVAAAHGLAVRRHPIGFKHLAHALASGEADVAGEESGGFALSRFGNDKDGMLASCLLVEIAATSRQPLRVRLAELARRHGSFVCGRRALPGGERAREALASWLAAPPTQVDGDRVRQVSRADGLHLSLDDGFLMLRASGTEPLLRVYAEARGAQRLRRRLAAGEALLGVSGVSPGSG
jgi:phosphoglucomutase